MSDIDFSILIPTFNRPNLLREAIKSAISQDINLNFEILVIDNDADNAYHNDNIVNEFNFANLRYIRNAKNLGMYQNWNEGLKHIKSNYVTILHDDDYLYPNYLQKMWPYIKSKKFDLITPLHNSSRPSPKSLKKSIKALIFNLRVQKIKKIRNIDLFFVNPVTVVGTVIRKDYFLELNGINPTLYPSGDYDFWARYIEKRSGHILFEKLGVYRVENNASLTPETAKLFAIQDFHIRSKICKNSRLLSLIAKFFEAELIIQSIKRVESDFGNTLNRNGIFNELNVPFRTSKIKSQILNLINLVRVLSL